MARSKGARTRVVCIEDRGGTGERRFRVKYVLDGDPDVECFATEEAAKDFARKLTKEATIEAGPVVDTAITAFANYMLAEKLWRADSSSKTTAVQRLRRFHAAVLEVPVGAVAARDLVEADQRFNATHAVKTTNEHIKIARSFWTWSVRVGKHRRTSPAEALRLRRGEHTGRPTLTRDEARKFVAAADAEARNGVEDAVLALACLWLGPRAGEIRTRLVRDVDDGGAILHSIDIKSRKPHRIDVPAPLSDYLAALAANRAPEARLFKRHGKNYPSACVARYCNAAGIPLITAQGARATHDTLGVQANVANQLIAAATGHTVAVMRRNYLAPGVEREARHARSIQVLQGGKAGSDSATNHSQDAAAAVTNGNDERSKGVG